MYFLCFPLFTTSEPQHQHLLFLHPFSPINISTPFYPSPPSQKLFTLSLRSWLSTHHYIWTTTPTSKASSFILYYKFYSILFRLLPATISSSFLYGLCSPRITTSELQHQHLKFPHKFSPINITTPFFSVSWKPGILLFKSTVFASHVSLPSTCHNTINSFLIPYSSQIFPP